jgi:hypothetical protein
VAGAPEPDVNLGLWRRREVPDSDTGWNRNLTKPLRTKDGRTLVTLSAAGPMWSTSPSPIRSARLGSRRARLMLEAAEGGDIEAATEQLKRVLFVDARLDLSREWMRFVKKSQ